MSKKLLSLLIIFFIVLGIADTAYLSFEHFTNFVPPCPVHSVLGSFIDCNKVLTSVYSQFFGIPLAYLGLAYFLALFLLKFVVSKKIFFGITTLALTASGYLIYLQLFVLHAICIYCMICAGVNIILFALAGADFINVSLMSGAIIKDINSNKSTDDTPDN